MSNKTSPKNRTEKSLNTLVLIILLLSFGLVGSLVYESNVQANDNKITGKVSGLERVSGFAMVTLRPQDVIVGKYKPTTPTPSTPVTAPSATKLKKYAVDVGDNTYRIIFVDESNPQSINIKVYRGFAKKEGDRITGYEYDSPSDLLSEEYFINAEVLKGAILQNWNGRSSEIPIPGGSRDGLLCVGGTTCRFTDTLKDGTKIIKSISPELIKEERFKTIFLDENNNEITAKEAEELKKKGESVTPVQIRTFWREEKRDSEGKIESITTYSLSLEKGTEVYEGIKRDASGNLIEFIYGERDLVGSAGDNRVVLKSGTPSPFGLWTSAEVLGCYRNLESVSCDKSLESAAATRLKQEASRQFFANIERVLTEFRGLGYYATLFFDEDSLLAWRDTVDRAFATLYLGTEYWSSAICSTYLDGEDEGIAYAETPQGLAQIGAHIEATRTEQIFTDKGREFIYKITFAIRNGDYAKDPRAPEEMNFNVVLKGERTVNVFRQDQEVKRGSTFSRVGRNAIVQDSPTLFTQICIRFDEIPLRWKLDNKELCNVIVESAGEAEPLTTTTTTAPSAGTAPESEINDF